MPATKKNKIMLEAKCRTDYNAYDENTKKYIRDNIGPNHVRPDCAYTVSWTVEIGSGKIELCNGYENIVYDLYVIDKKIERAISEDKDFYHGDKDIIENLIQDMHRPIDEIIAKLCFHRGNKISISSYSSTKFFTHQNSPNSYKIPSYVKDAILNRWFLPMLKEAMNKKQWHRLKCNLGGFGIDFLVRCSDDYSTVLEVYESIINAAPYSEDRILLHEYRFLNFDKKITTPKILENIQHIWSSILFFLFKNDYLLI